MSNNWYYKLFFSKEMDFHDRILKVFEILKTYKVSLAQTQDSLIIVRDSSGLKELEFQNATEAAKFLSKEGGLLQVWSVLAPLMDWNFDFHIYFNAGQNLSKKSQILLPENSIGEIDISIGDFIYRQDDTDDNARLTVASLIKHIFADICISQNAIYGFSADEYMQEEYAINLSSIIPDVLFGKAPLNFFWLNYFSSKLFLSLSREKISLIHGKIEPLNKGAFVSFFNYPWEVRIQDLIMINEKWSRLKK